MNKCLSALMILGFFAVTAQQALAGIEPVILRLNESSPSYTVPSDKVLLIEHGYSGEDSGAVNIVLIMTSSNLTTGMRVGEGWYRSLTSFSPALKIPSGWTLTATNFTNIDGEGQPDPTIDNFILLIGLLIDPIDLYAGIEHQIDAFSIAAMNGTLGLDLGSSRPRVIQAEVSNQLGSWAPVDVAAIMPSDQRRRVDITLPANAEAEFFRTRVRGR